MDVDLRFTVGSLESATPGQIVRWIGSQGKWFTGMRTTPAPRFPANVLMLSEGDSGLHMPIQPVGRLVSKPAQMMVVIPSDFVFELSDAAGAVLMPIGNSEPGEIEVWGSEAFMHAATEIGQDPAVVDLRTGTVLSRDHLPERSMTSFPLIVRGWLLKEVRRNEETITHLSWPGTKPAT